MNTMNIPRPDSFKEQVNPQVSSLGLSYSKECEHQLIRNNQSRQQLRGLLLAGAQSAPTGRIDAAYFDALRKRISSKKSR